MRGIKSYRQGWRGNPYGHALARAGVKTKQRSARIESDFDKARIKRRGKIYEVDLKNDALTQPRQKREINRIKKMSLAEIKRKYQTQEAGRY